MTENDKKKEPKEEIKYSIVSKLRQVLCSGIMFNRMPTILTESEMIPEIFKHKDLEITKIKPEKEKEEKKK